MADTDPNQSLTTDLLILDTVKKVRDQKEAGNTTAYCDDLEFLIQLLVDYMEPKIRVMIGADHALLTSEIARIKLEEANEVSRKRKITELRENWADAHRGYALAALSKVNLIKPSDEGLIDFDKLGAGDKEAGMAKVASIVRSADGIATATRKALEPKGAK